MGERKARSEGMGQWKAPERGGHGRGEGEQGTDREGKERRQGKGEQHILYREQLVVAFITSIVPLVYMALNNRSISRNDFVPVPIGFIALHKLAEMIQSQPISWAVKYLIKAPG